MKLFQQFRDWVWPVSEQAYLSRHLRAPFGQPTFSGINVSEEQSLSISGVWQAVALISGQMASMDFAVYRRGKGGAEPDRSHPAYDLVAYQPNEEMNASDFRRAMMLHVLLWGNAYVLLARDFEGRLESLTLLDVKAVQAMRNNSGRLYYSVNGRKYWPESIIHIKNTSLNGIVGLSPIDAARDNLGLTKALELYGSSFFGNGATPGGFLKSERKLNKEAEDQLKEILNSEHQGVGKAHKIHVLPPGVEWLMNNVPPETAQYLLSRVHQIGETARIFNLDRADLGDYSQGRPATVEEANLQLYTRTLSPWCNAIEMEFNSKLFSREERQTFFVNHDMTSLLRGNSNARADYWTKMYNLGAVGTNKVIGEENLGPTIGPAGDQHFIPENNLTSLEQIHKDLNQPAETEAKPVDQKVDQAADIATDVPVANSAMNGAQLASLTAIVAQVTSGQIPVATAKAILKAGFPSLDDLVIDGMLSPLATFKPVTATDPAATPAAGDAVAAVRSVLQDSVQRMIRREAEAIRRAANKPDTFSSTVDQFWQKHQAIVTEAVGPSVRAFVTVAQTSEDPDQLTLAIANELVTESRSTLSGLDCGSATFADDVGIICDQWLETRAKTVVEVL